MKKLIPALCLLLVTAVMMGTSTYAWFSSNAKVAVSGMEVTTDVGSSMMIANATAGTTKSADSAFGSYADQLITGKVKPCSTINGTNFYKTENARADGTKESGDYSAIGSTTSDYYLDYVVELKAVNSGATDAYIQLDELNLIYNNASLISTDKAYRVAVFVQAVDTAGTSYKGIGTTADAIYSVNGATYFTSGKAVKSTTERDSVSHLNTNHALDSAMKVAAGKTAYYKVTLRFWLEGEDTSCYNENYSTKTGTWKLSASFKLGSESVDYITGNNPSSTVNFSETLGYVTSTIGATGTTPSTIPANRVVTATYTPSAGYLLPATITVTRNGTALVEGTDKDYEWNAATGELYIHSNVITDAISVSVTAVKPTVTLHLTDVTGTIATGSSINANENFTDTYTATTGTLSDTITVKCGKNTLTIADDYTWDESTGELVVFAAAVTGNLDITIEAVN